MTEEHAFIEWKAEQYKHQCTEEELEFVEHLHNFPRYFKKTFLDGYHECQKANEWHYVKDGDFPTEITEKTYLVALKSEYTNDFFFETDIWCKSLHCFASNNPKKVYAWKEIVLPELPKELSKKWVDNYEDYQNASNDITFSQYPVYRGK